jgi:uncharacterized protein
MSNKRIYGYDIARALAIFGMVIVNFKTVMHKNGHDDSGWLSIFNLLDGRASAIFVILAGVGITLLTNSARLAGNKTQLNQEKIFLLRRAIFLFFIGLLYIEIWPADILHYYGIYIAIGAMLIAASTQHLLWTAGGIALAFPIIFSFQNYTTAWNWETLAYADFWSAEGFIRNLLFNGFHPVFPWAAFLVIGMALGRLPMNKPTIRNRVLFFGFITTAIIEATSLLMHPILSNYGYSEELINYLFSTTPMPPLPLYFLSATGSSLAIIALCVYVGEKYQHSAWLRPFIYTGQLALTLYVAHVVIGMGLLEELGLLANQPLSMAIESALLFCVGSIIFSYFWRSRFKLGPLEWLIRKVTFTS